MAQVIGFDEDENSEDTRLSPLLMSTCVAGLFITLGLLLSGVGLFLSITSYEIALETTERTGRIFGSISLGFFGLSLAAIGFAIGLKEMIAMRRLFCKTRRNDIEYHQTPDVE